MGSFLNRCLRASKGFVHRDKNPSPFSKCLGLPPAANVSSAWGSISNGGSYPKLKLGHS